MIHRVKRIAHREYPASAHNRKTVFVLIELMDGSFVVLPPGRVWTSPRWWIIPGLIFFLLGGMMASLLARMIIEYYL